MTQHDDLSKALLDIKQASALLRCDTDSLAKRLNRGELPGLKIGTGWIIPIEAFYQRLNELALEEAERRRSEKRQTKPAAPALPSVVAAQSQRGRQRRAPIDLSRYNILLSTA